MGLLITLIILVLVVGAAYWAVTQIGSAMGLPAPVIVTAQVLIVILALLWIVQSSGLG